MQNAVTLYVYSTAPGIWYEMAFDYSKHEHVQKHYHSQKTAPTFSYLEISYKHLLTH